MPLESFEAETRGLVDSGAERHPGIHFDAEAAGRSGIVAPNGDEVEALADFGGLQQIAGGLHPIALLFHAEGRAGIETLQALAAGALFEKGADARRRKLSDTSRALHP